MIIIILIIKARSADTVKKQTGFLDCFHLMTPQFFFKLINHSSSVKTKRSFPTDKKCRYSLFPHPHFFSFCFFYNNVLLHSGLSEQPGTNCGRWDVLDGGGSRTERPGRLSAPKLSLPPAAARCWMSAVLDESRWPSDLHVITGWTARPW